MKMWPKCSCIVAACGGSLSMKYLALHCASWVSWNETVGGHWFAILGLLTRQQNPRLYGGLNVIFVGDYKQLPPVAERALFANPFSTGLNLSGPEKRLSDALWGLSPETFPDEPGSCMVLHRQHRTDDPWQQHVLSELRAGKETWETYCFTHGLPTQHVGTWLPGQAFCWLRQPNVSGRGSLSCAKKGYYSVSAMKGIKMLQCL